MYDRVPRVISDNGVGRHQLLRKTLEKAEDGLLLLLFIAIVHARNGSFRCAKEAFQIVYDYGCNYCLASTRHARASQNPRRTCHPFFECPGSKYLSTECQDIFN